MPQLAGRTPTADNPTGDGADTTADNPTGDGAQGGRARLWYLDNLRSCLTLLVVVHHLNLTILMHPGVADATFRTVGGLVNAANQAFFMGLFFLLSGYFVPQALSRKGPARFVRDRLLRLGVPFLVYFFGLSQLSVLPMYVLEGRPFTWATYQSTIGPGHMWFALVLLLFCAVAALLGAIRRRRPVRRHEPATPGRTPGLLAGVLFTVALAAVTYAVRLVIPLLQGATPPAVSVPWLSSALAFLSPTSGELPQYVALFVIGTLAARRDRLRRLRTRSGVVGAVAAAVATLTLLPAAFATSGGPYAFLGGATLSSALYASWEAVFCVGVCTGLLVLFRRFADRTNRFWGFLSGHSFTVYVVHFGIITAALVVLSLSAVPAVAWYPITFVTVPVVCYALAAAIRRIPGVARVI